MAAGTATVAFSTPPVSAAAGDLLFSQYIEGSSLNKAVEVANTSGGPIDLADYTIERYTNGSPTVGAEIELAGTLAAGDVFVVANPGSSPAILDVADLESGSANWNGNDAIVLREESSGLAIDSFGQVGVDPGSAWANNGVSSQDDSLCRSSDVTTGDAIPDDAFDPSVEWESKGLDNIDGLGIAGCELVQDGDLLFTQYVEGSSSNKALEIANTTGVDIDLSAYTIELYANGAATPGNTQPLSGTLVDGDVFVVVNASANADILAVGDLASTVTFYNGDDALVLRNNVTTDVVDSIGRVGEDPGTEWAGGSVSTLNDTLCRLDTVTAGDTVIDDAFDPSVEWESKGIDNIDGLGELGCNPPPEAGSVIFTQYVEGTSNNKAIEISNLGASPVDLSVYDLERYSNGSESPATLDLTGTLAPGEAYVVANPSSNADILAVTDLQSGNASWNGDDAIVLRDGTGNVADSFGEVGFDPGTNWGVDETSTVNNTLCRLGSVTAGDIVIDDVFDPALEWFGIGEDNIVGLGSIGCSLDPIGDLIFTQYMEGSSNNKAIEIANLTGAPLDLADYRVEIYFNGSATVSTTIVPTAGVLAADDVYVIANTSSNAAILAVADQTSGSANWNGDDAIVLRNFVSGDVADTVGQVGNDPGSEWGDAALGTQDDTLCRNSDIGSTDGDTNPTDPFDPAATWTSLGLDSVVGLGEVGCEIVVPPTVVKIHEVQGSGPTSTILGENVAVEAVVTTLFENDDVVEGFFIQEEDADIDGLDETSEGLYVFCSSLCPVGLAPGDLVSVVGTVSEFAGNTQISATSTPDVVSSGNPTPTPATVALPAPTGTDQESTFESVEGMLTSVESTLTVSEYFELARFGSIVLTAGGRPYQFTHESIPSDAGLAAYTAELAKRQIVLDDGNDDQNETITPTDEPYPFPSPGLSTTNRFRGGDTITGLTGAMRYSFGQWTIVQSPQLFDYTFEPTNPFPAVPNDVGGTLKVASFNVLNFFTTVDVTSSTSSGDCGPSGTADCRGGDSQEEVDRQLAKLVTALAGIDADVLGLIELENADSIGGVDPVLSTIVGALNAAVGAGTYDFIDTGFIGTDAIRVAMLYKPSTVTPAGAFDILDQSDDARFIDSRNRPMLTQTFDEVASGERFSVSVNHLKSKGSGCGAGDDATDGSGNCNGTRTMAAAAIIDHLAGDPTGSGDPDFLIIGDLNAYRLETPISTLEAGGYTDLIKALVGDDAYSYVFDSQLGYLDHALASESLVSQVTGITEWHINADEIPLFDYNDDVLDPGEASFEKESGSLPLYSVDPARTSDHDPVIVGLQLQPPPPPKVLFVVGAVRKNGSIPKNDSAALGIMDDLGYDVDPINDDGISASDADGYDMVVISSSVVHRKVGDTFTDVAIPVLTWEGYIFDDLGFNTDGRRANGETRSRQRVLEIVDASHPMAAGYTGYQAVTNVRSRFSYSASPEGDVQIVAEVREGAVLFGYENGAQMAGDMLAPARRVGIFPSYQSARSFTDVGEDIFAAALTWTIDS